MKSALLLLLFIGTLTPALAQTVRYVKPGGTGNGSSWTNASGNLQAMINASTSGQQVWVAVGTYKPGTVRTASFVMKAGVAIYGGFVGSETSLSQRPATNPVSGSPSGSTLSGDIGTVGDNTDNCYHVINNSSNTLTNTAVLDGFVITGGNADGDDDDQTEGGAIVNGGSSPTLTNCSFRANTAYSGGAIKNSAASPRLTNCSFQNNTAFYAGAIDNANSNPTLTNCGFQTNTATYGGAVFNGGSSPTLTNCSFQNNDATYGGAIGNSDSSPTVTSCSFQANTASETGGAIDNFNSSSPTLTNCGFQTNAASSGGAIENFGGSNATVTNCSFQTNAASSTGGAINNSESNPRVTNCSFRANTASSTGGGAIGNLNSSPTLTNCSFQSNTTSALGGAIYHSSVAPAYQTTLTNCVLWNNGGSNALVNGDDASIPFVVATYSLFENTVTGYNTGGTGNKTTTTNPFVSAGSTQLATGSPAINAGSVAAYNNGTFTVTYPATDLAGNPRLRTTGSTKTIDMGAFQFQGALPVTLRYFSGRTTDAGAVLGWATAREEKNAYFQIERSRDPNRPGDPVGAGFAFESIATVPSQAVDGNSITELTYSYLDAQSLPGTTYYRLMQTDRDGSRTTHHIIALSRDNAPSVLFPNPVPASGEASIEPGIAHTGYQISDVLGRVVQRQDAPGLLGRVSLAGLPAGVYVLYVQTTNGGIRTWRLLR